MSFGSVDEVFELMTLIGVHFPAKVFPTCIVGLVAFDPVFQVNEERISHNPKLSI